MRKFALILLGFLLFTAGGPSCLRASTHPAAAISVDRASDEVWLCERTCNSDLNLSRIPVAASPAASTLLGGSHAQFQRAAVRHAACVWGSGMPGRTSFFVYPFLHAAPAVDYYVYRLRRLII